MSYCSNCSSPNLVKFGKYKDKQRYKCENCGIVTIFIRQRRLKKIKGEINMEKTLEEIYNIKTQEVKIERVTTPSGKVLEVFDAPSNTSVITIEDPEFTCNCPRTAHPDFATLFIHYIPSKKCVELKSLKYYINSFRNEGHFHEQVTKLIHDDLVAILNPTRLGVTLNFLPRGGIYTTVEEGNCFGD